MSQSRPSKCIGQTLRFLPPSPGSCSAEDALRTQGQNPREVNKMREDCGEEIKSRGKESRGRREQGSNKEDQDGLLESASIELGARNY